MVRQYKKRRLFITGTDTGVGKTLVAAGLIKLARLKGMRSLGVKPVETGCRLMNGMFYPEDGTFLKKASDHDLSLDECTPFRFSTPASPARAAAMEGRILKVSDLVEHISVISEDADLTVIEGAGGLMVPIEDELMMIDLIKDLQAPAIIVARTKLGTINHTLLSVMALKQREIPLAGVVLSQTDAELGPEEQFTPGDISRILKDVPVMVFPFLESSVKENPLKIAQCINELWRKDILAEWLG